MRIFCVPIGYLQVRKNRYMRAARGLVVGCSWTCSDSPVGRYAEEQKNRYSPGQRGVHTQAGHGYACLPVLCVQVSVIRLRSCICVARDGALSGSQWTSGHQAVTASGISGVTGCNDRRQL